MGSSLEGGFVPHRLSVTLLVRFNCLADSLCGGCDAALLTMVRYSNRELADMVFTYGKANGNGRRAARLYRETYPRRQQPQHTMFATMFRRLSETGSFREVLGNREGRDRNVRTPDLEERVINTVEDDRRVSTRELARQYSVSQTTVWNILHENCYYPYHLQRVQGLQVTDFPLRERFCRWFIQQATTILGFVSSILFTDEATFTRNGVINFHNSHLWDMQNPHGMVTADHQHRFSLNVWAGIFGDRILGPVILPHRLTGQDYRRFLRVTLPPLLEEVPLIVRRVMWLQHDGAPAHFAIIVRRYLNRVFPGRWIGRGGPVAWPARSPDLNPCDFYLWGHLKTIVYAEPIPDVETLEERIHSAFDAVRMQPGICERVRQNMLRRVRSCVEARGNHFEHLL